MAKELPYFKFEPAEYLTKNISFCSLSAQGLFVNICSYYWQRNCSLTKEQLLRRLNYELEFNELVTEGIIDLVKDNISIKFLDAQLIDVQLKSSTNSVNGSKGGRPKKNPTETETKPNALESETETISETKGIREDKIIEEEKKEDKIKVNKSEIFNFKKSLVDYGFKESLVDDWLKVRKTKKATNTETAFNKFINQYELSGYDLDTVLEKCIEKSWSGFEANWFKKETIQLHPNGFGRTTQKLMKYEND